METMEEGNFNETGQDIFQEDNMMAKGTKQNKARPSSTLQSVADSKVEEKDAVLERSKYVYEQVNGWIENADNKVNVSCGIFTGIFGVVTFLSERTTGNIINNECWHCLYRVSFIVSLILLGASILAYVFAINPNLGSSGEKAEKNQKRFPIYFGDIASIKKPEDYKRQISLATDDDFLNELLDEIHYNSCICKRKMANFKWSLWLSFTAVVFAMISWVAKYFMFQ